MKPAKRERRNRVYGLQSIGKREETPERSAKICQDIFFWKVGSNSRQKGPGKNNVTWATRKERSGNQDLAMAGTFLSQAKNGRDRGEKK